MATIYYEISYGDSPFIVNIIGDGVNITETKWATGTYYFTGLNDGMYVISVTSATGCVEAFEVDINCATTTSTTTVCDVYAEILSFCNVEELPTTTTTSTTVNPEAAIECLEGLIIESLYIGTTYDYGLLSHPEYTHPCYYSIGSHRCNRSLFEVFANGEYIGDFRMNNDGGVGGGQTAHSGNYICQEYTNKLPYSITGGLEPTAISKYDKITLTYQQAVDIATATGGSTMVTFSMIPAVDTYDVTCSGEDGAHSGITWVRISKSTGELIYNGCPEGNIVTLDVCTGSVSTTTSTTLPLKTYFVYYDNLTTTTSTTLPD